MQSPVGQCEAGNSRWPRVDPEIYEVSRLFDARYATVPRESIKIQAAISCKDPPHAPPCNGPLGLRGIAQGVAGQVAVPHEQPRMHLGPDEHRRAGCVGLPT
jgi:hypothetical protein